jgi:hypothetical protein
VRFWFTPADPLALNVVRVLAGLLFLAWLLPLAGQVDALFGFDGWFDQRAYSEAKEIEGISDRLPAWSIVYLVGTNSTLLHLTYWAAIGIFALFTVGLWPRLTAVLSWVAVALFTVSPAVDFEADCLLLILAFYLIVGYLFMGLLSKGRSLDERLLGPGGLWPFRRARGERPRSVAANVALRLLQVHLAIVLVTSGLHKLQTSDWWAGVAFWYPLYPPSQTTLKEVLALGRSADSLMALLSVAAYATLVWQIGFPLFAWRQRWWRLVLVGGGMLGWLATALLYEVPVFGPAIFIGCLSFLTPEEWRWVLGWPGRLLRSRGTSAAAEGHGRHSVRKEESQHVVAARQP